MSTDLDVGATFAGRYRILRRIASGGMGAVYEVVHLETNRHRALKVMHPDLVQSEESRSRFRQEARVTAQIGSEFIVDVFDAGIDDATSTPFLVMELLRGEEISKRIRRAGRLQPDEALLHLHQTALALDKTHRARIVHRDLKPDNLFLCEREDGPPQIKVLDFGIAKMVSENQAAVNATQAVGTPLYMAPEQFLPDSNVSPATDRYALGMIAYMLLVGKPYWRDESRDANLFTFASIVMRGPPEPATARALRMGVKLPPAFDAWFAKATAKVPEERFSSATGSIAALAEALGLSMPSGAGARLSLPGVEPSPAEGAVATIPPGRASMPSLPGHITSPGPATLLNSEVTSPSPRPRKRPALVIGGGALAACILGGVLYASLSSGSPGAPAATSPVPAAPATQASQAGEVMPAAPTNAITPSASAPAESAHAESATAPKKVPTAPTTKWTAPRATATAAAGQWVRD